MAFWDELQKSLEGSENEKKEEGKIEIVEKEKEKVEEVSYPSTIMPEDVEVRDEKELLEDIKVVRLEQLVQRRGLKILVYGRPAVGKTRFCLTAPSPIFFIDTEFAVGAFSGSDIVKGKQIDVVNIFAINPNKWEMDSVRMVYDIEKILAKLHLSKNSNQYSTVCLDSATSLWKYLQDWLRYEVVRLGGKINIKGVPADRRDWAKANSKYYAIMQTLIAGNWNVVATVQSQLTYDSNGNPIGYKPSMQKDTEFYFDIVMALDKKEGSDGKMRYYGKIVKCRFPVGIEGMIIENPDFDKIYNLVMGKEGKQGGEKK